MERLWKLVDAAGGRYRPAYLTLPGGCRELASGPNHQATVQLLLTINLTCVNNTLD